MVTCNTVIGTGDLRSHRSSKKAEALSHNGENKQSEQETVGRILLQEKSAASLLCRIKNLQTSDYPLFQDVLGIVATLGKAPDDNLSRLVVYKPFFSLFRSSNLPKMLILHVFVLFG